MLHLYQLLSVSLLWYENILNIYSLFFIQPLRLLSLPSYCTSDTPTLVVILVGGAAAKMASPFVPVPVPMGKALSGGSSKVRRPQRASSLGSVSSSPSCSPSTRAAREDHGGGRGAPLRQSRSMGRGSRSRTPPPLHSPVTQARVNGVLEPSMEYSSCPRSASEPERSRPEEERPITPTLLGYEVMEERAKFTVFSQADLQNQHEMSLVLSLTLTQERSVVGLGPRWLNMWSPHRCLRSWSEKVLMRAGLFSEGTQTSPDSTIRCVSCPSASSVSPPGC